MYLLKGKSNHLSTYGPNGQRIYKKVVANDGSGDVTETWYVRDAQGNVMGVYEEKNSTLYIQEHHLYGSSRLGIAQPWEETEVTEISISTDSTRYNRYLGNKFYELSNHLGNVLVTVTDQKQAVDDNGNVGYWKPTVASYSDYFPFGMQMPGRNGSTGNYRYGFNGQEKDDGIYGEGNSYTAEYWQYDARIGRRWNMDPVYKEYESSYATFGNNPIIYTDMTGADSTWALNSSTGEMTLMAGGGDEKYQTVVFDPVQNEDGSWQGGDATVVEGWASQLTVGPVAQGYDGMDPNITWAVSNHDFWSDLPDEYVGYYMIWDLFEREYYRVNNYQHYEAIVDYEEIGLEKHEMKAWNNSTYARYLNSRYGSSSLFHILGDNGLLAEVMPFSGPVQSVAEMTEITTKTILRSKQLHQRLAQQTSRMRRQEAAKILGMTGNGKAFSNNPWINFLHHYKGKYVGKGRRWINEALVDYKKLMKRANNF